MKNVGFFGPTEYHFWKPPCKWPFFRCQNPISKYHHLSPGELLCQNLDFEMERFCKKENPSCLRWKNFLLEKSFFFRNFFEKKYYFAQKIDQKSSIDRFPQPIRKSLQCFEAPNCFKFLEGPYFSFRICSWNRIAADSVAEVDAWRAADRQNWLQKAVITIITLLNVNECTLKLHHG